MIKDVTPQTLLYCHTRLYDAEMVRLQGLSRITESRMFPCCLWENQPVARGLNIAVAEGM